ncbi:DNA-directed RNA polymerase I subunit 1 isoform X2 [Populus alba x Populus x berolinensis]|nr:DNA-directed RNA polymerase I subunit 1 isoform X2 [Populus alba x Populus x berolinensis]
MAALEGATVSVDSVAFSFLTDEEVHKHSFVKITSARLLDTLDKPVPGGLYDPAMGPLGDEPCKTCGQRSTNCTGHCGHIDLISPVYNPLLFNFLHKLLQRTCFFCFHFRADSNQVEKFVSQLELIIKGDVVGAKRLDSFSPTEASLPEDSDGSSESCSTIHSGARHPNNEQSKQSEWTSLQLSEAMSILNNFLKLESKKCKNCSTSNPNIRKPTFGWFHWAGLSNAAIRSNLIKQQTIEGPFGGAFEELIDAEDATKSPLNKESATNRNLKEHQKLQHQFTSQKDALSSQLLPSEAMDILKLLWKNEARLCSLMSDIQQQGVGKKKAGHSMFFLNTVLVPPIKFRPPTKGGDSVMEHPLSVLLSKVLELNGSLADAHRNNDFPLIARRWLELQQSINVLFDSNTAKGQKDVISGICQILEKKEGMFRQKMMGKRVNYACRSVISPDPYLDVNEIGVPPCFAVKLTYPERVTPWNVAKLRNAVINGAESHPGATHYVDKLSTTKLPPNRKMRVSVARKLSGRSVDYEYEGKIVYRHLQDGDIVLVNRQPTLHKPSIMAHVVRVLKGEKTLRMHYANCSTYNADFDGDEMNVHFPQDEVSRAEGYNIVNANNQYVRPSNGEPLRSLIQDHIISAVLLTKKDTFLTEDEVYQLLYSSGVSNARPTSFSGKAGRKVIFLSYEDEIETLDPAIRKPIYLWSGKQLITAVLNHITRGHPPFTVEKGGKLSYDFFKNKIKNGKSSNGEKGGVSKPMKEKESGKVNPKEKQFEDDKMIIFRNVLVQGVIDKAQFGEYGLVHTVQELFGAKAAGTLLSVFSRLFTAYLQMHGFTCGVDDLLITKIKDDERKKQLENCEKCGEQIHRKFIGIKDENIKIDPLELQSNIEKTIRSDGESALTYLDRQMTNELNSKTSSGVINELLSEGLLKPSGKNCISLMTTSGAKGSKVNFQQISSFLGQQELEGKRVPRMVSGKTLPCFHPWDWAARAGGYIIDRFLTGLRPQEYYFHCMAGREGLVDTAVKTSRSGYLQRCLIKNLECLRIGYDHTVRDADGSIVQFYYGEDGVDVHQTGFIAKFEALAANREIMLEKSDELGTFNAYISELPKALKEKAETFLRNIAKEQSSLHYPTRDRSSNLAEHDFYKLLKQKFFLSLAQPGEPVGVLAAQSVGEPSTQMTLNTFHLAGRGEMNVTLGIPRLQEILMTASADIKTPIMTCPLQEGRTKEDAERLSDKLKKVTVADIVESMEVSVMPFAVQNDDLCRIYKLKMKLYTPAHYPQHTDISVENWEETLEVLFVRELEDAIQNHLVLLSKISGIKNFLKQSHSGTPIEAEEDVSGNISREGENNDDSDDEEGEEADDLGLDVQKRKQQVTDEMDYDDGSEGLLNEDEGDLSGSQAPSGSESDTESADKESDTESADKESEISNTDMVDYDSEYFEKPTHHGNYSKPKSRKKTSESSSQVEMHSKLKSTEKKKQKAKGKKVRSKLVKKDFDRSIFVEAKGLHFEIHLKFDKEPHILLAEIAQKTAKKVCIQNPGKVQRCQVTDCKENQVIYYGKDPMRRIDIEPGEKQKIPALHTIGVDFNTFWKMQDHLDVRYMYSNSIHGMLKAYGVEAARETIIREIKHVFNSYGISVNTRHLSLIADYMTHTGEYRPMSRIGGISESISPLSKMSFETASKFIVEAALHGEVDNLEAPSARVCLGLPVKMGTGSFDLMQKLEI